MKDEVKTSGELELKVDYKIFTEPGKTIKKSKIIRIDLFNNFNLWMVKEIYILENWRIKKDSGHFTGNYRRIYLEII